MNDLPKDIAAKMPAFQECWDALDAEGRQCLIDHWAMILTCEELKAMGLVAGDVGVDVDEIRLFYGFALGRGYVPNFEQSNVESQMALLVRRG